MIYHLIIHHSVEAAAKQVTSIGSPAWRSPPDFAVLDITIGEKGSSTEGGCIIPR